MEYLRRDPAVVTRYLKEEKRLESEIGKVHEELRKTKKVNKEPLISTKDSFLLNSRFRHYIQL